MQIMQGGETERGEMPRSGPAVPLDKPGGGGYNNRRASYIFLCF